MRKLVLIGGGGHCKSVLDAATASGEFDEIVITDPELETGSLVLATVVKGSDECLMRLKEEGFEYAFITVGSIETADLRKKLSEKVKDLGFLFSVICDSSDSISKYAHIGAGSFIGKNASVNAEAQIGEHCIINTGSIVEHECKIGDYTMFR